MKKFRWQLIVILVTGFIVGLLLLFQKTAQNPDTQETPNPVSGGIYTEALVGNFMRLNPFLDIYNQPDEDVDQLIFSGLVKFGANGMPEPDLAETWGISQEGTVYTFSLRKDISWHDGVKVTSADVIFTVNLLKSENALIPEDLQKFWSEVEVRANSDALVQFFLPEAFSPFPDYMTFELLPEHLLGGLSLDEMIDHPFNLAPVGTGPFVFNRLLMEDDQITGVVLDANSAFYGGRPYLDEIVFMYYPDHTAALNAYQQGIVDGFGEVQLADLNQVLADASLNLYSVRSPRLTMVFLNLENDRVEFFQDAQFRRALIKAIDRQEIIDSVYHGQAIQAQGPIMPGSWAYFDSIEQMSYDPEGATSIIASLGYTKDTDQGSLISKDELPVSFKLLVPNDFTFIQTANLLKAEWARLGIMVEINVMPFDEVITLLDSRDYEAALVNIDFSGSADPDPYPFWGQAQASSGQNYSQWNNRSASELIEQARITSDYNSRERLYRNFQVIFQEEMPSLPLFYPVYSYAIKAKINAVSIGPFFDESDRLASLPGWYILATTNESTAQPASEDKK